MRATIDCSFQFRLFTLLKRDASCLTAKGFYLKYDEMKTDPNVQKWDVHILTVSIGFFFFFNSKIEEKD